MILACIAQRMLVLQLQQLHGMRLYYILFNQYLPIWKERSEGVRSGEGEKES